MPQILFNFRHENILFNNFKKLFFEEQGFRGVTKFLLENRSEYYWRLAQGVLYSTEHNYVVVIIIAVALIFIVYRKRFKKYVIPILLIFLFTPVIGYIFFQGNNTILYGYYTSGYYMQYLLLIAIGLAEYWRLRGGKVVVGIFLFLILQANGTLIRNTLIDEREGDTDIVFKHQLNAIDWVFENSKGRGEFNVDVYVPPVIPHAYDYLFLWQADKRCGESLCGMIKEPTNPSFSPKTFLNTKYTLQSENILNIVIKITPPIGSNLVKA